MLIVSNCQLERQVIVIVDFDQLGLQSLMLLPFLKGLRNLKEAQRFHAWHIGIFKLQVDRISLRQFMLLPHTESDYFSQQLLGRSGLGLAFEERGLKPLELLQVDRFHGFKLVAHLCLDKSSNISGLLL